VRKTIAILTTVGVLIPLAAQAFNEPVWLMLNGVGGTYSMSALNAEIDAINAANAGSGFSFAHVTNGNSFGGSVGYEASSKWNFGVGVDRLEATTVASDAAGAVEFRLGANAWRAFGEYALRPLGHSTLFLGGAIGIIQENGKIIDAPTGYAPVAYDTYGADPMVEGHVGGNWWVTPRFAVTAIGGYRYARVKQIRVEDAPYITATGERLSLDFSGASLRIGIKLAANNPSGE
jgi:hypothetical protein